MVLRQRHRPKFKIIKNTRTHNVLYFFLLTGVTFNALKTIGSGLGPGPASGRGSGVGAVKKIKSNRNKNDFISNQIKSRTFLQGVKSNQIMILGKKFASNQIKSIQIKS